jgi:polar amino acid transport system substrate-binding protein
MPLAISSVCGALVLATLLAAFAQDIREARNVLAPGGTLRAVFLASNPVQARIDAKTGAASGPAVEIVAELARRLGVSHNISGLDGVPAVMAAVAQGSADIGFLAFDPTRAEQVAFSQPYSIGHNAYMVREDSFIRSVDDADRKGIRIGVGAGDAVDLHLSRTLKQASIVRPSDRAMPQVVRMLLAGELDAYAANRQRLTEALSLAPNLRLIPGSVLGVQQSIVVRKDNVSGVAALNRFIDDIRASGQLERIVAGANLAGVEVAPGPSR